MFYIFSSSSSTIKQLQSQVTQVITTNMHYAMLITAVDTSLQPQGEVFIIHQPALVVKNLMPV